MTGPDGALWYTSTSSGSIGRVTIDGEFSSFPYDGVAGSMGIATGDDGALWFTRHRDHSISRMTVDGAVTTFKDPGMRSPGAIVAGPDGALWFTSYDPGRSIGRITLDGDVSIFEDDEIGRDATITVGADGNLWFTGGSGVRSVGRITPTGAITHFPTPGISPSSITSQVDGDLEPAGDLWFTGTGSTISRMTVDGEITTFNVSSWSGGAIAATSDGNVWFTKSLSGDEIVSRITPDGDVTTYAGGEGYGGVRDLTVGPDGNLWFTQSGTAIVRMTPSGEVTIFPGNGIVHPRDIVAGPDGAMWFTNFGSSSIGRVAPDGTVSNFTTQSTSLPMSITVGPHGNLWFTNSRGPGSVGRITTDGVITEFPLPNVREPDAITRGPDGNLWFTHHGGIGRITPAGDVTVFEISSYRRPTSIVTGRDGNLWFTNGPTAQRPDLAGSIGRITPDGVVAEFSDARMGAPAGITSGPDGNLWFTNTKWDVDPMYAGDEETHSAIVRLTPNGTFTFFEDPISRSNRFGSELIVGRDGNLWFGTIDGSIGSMTLSGTVASYPTLDTEMISSIAPAPDGSIWFIRTVNATFGRLVIPGVGPCSDVPAAHVFASEIEWMVDAGITTGFVDGTFRPTVAVERQAMAAFLWRMAGEPESELAEPFFADVPEGHVFYEAIQWMAEEGLSTGTVDDGGKPLFVPTSPVSRQAMAAFLWRAQGEPAPTGDDAFFADVAEGAPFFEAIQWMGESGLSTGTVQGGERFYGPLRPVSRQAAAAFLHRLASAD